jgi:dienelactone hydrolase
MFIRNLLILTCLSLSACATHSPAVRLQQADKLAMNQHWQRESISTQTFDLITYVPNRIATNKTLTIYIEGDGLAWLSRYRRSSDPTPKNPLALKLALRHPSGNVVYLARPCQFASEMQARNCSKKYWSSHRFAPEVISSTNEAITVFKNRLQARDIILVGYSGGAAVAALVSARRDDVKQLITVAGNLDHLAWTRLKNISPLSGSLNPADAWRKLVDIPQIHFVGSKDNIIDQAVTHSYQQHFPLDKKPQVRVIDGFDHHCCWSEHWAELLSSADRTKISR